VSREEIFKSNGILKKCSRLRGHVMKPPRVRSVSLVLILFLVLTLALPTGASSEAAEVLVQIRTINLNKEPLTDVLIEVYSVADGVENRVGVGMTNQTGWVGFHVANDSYYSFKAFWGDALVGGLPKQHITSNVTINNFNCSLAHLKTVVIGEAKVTLPYVNVTLTYSYLTAKNQSVSKSYTFETDENGTIVVSNLLTKANYTMEARRHGLLFNRTLIPDFSRLLKDGWANVTIVCPTYTLLVHVVDSDKVPLPSVQVEVYEWGSQVLVGSGATNDRGGISFNCSFGKYKIRVHTYSDELKRRVVLNETVTGLTEDPTSLMIHSKIFNIRPSVKVVDYFGQPIPNAMVEVERKIDHDWVKVDPLRKTDSFGGTSLPTIGGEYRISMYVSGELCETRTLYLDETRVVVFKTDKYIVIGGNPIGTSQLTTYISMILLVAVLGLALTYRKLSQIILRKKAPS